jgi:hypothetical protein
MDRWNPKRLGRYAIDKHFHIQSSRSLGFNPDSEVMVLTHTVIPQLRFVSAIGRPYLILFRSHHCRVCNRNFQGYDPDALSYLPAAAQEQFPCFMFRKSALDKDLARLTMGLIDRGLVSYG